MASGRWYFYSKVEELSDSLLNVEGNIFFSVVARRLVSYLKANSFIDISVQKVGISGFLNVCSMILHEIQAARTKGRDLSVVFLDLANHLWIVATQSVVEDI